MPYHAYLCDVGDSGPRIVAAGGVRNALLECEKVRHKNATDQVSIPYYLARWYNNISRTTQHTRKGNLVLRCPTSRVVAVSLLKLNASTNQF
jgi:hypothetical protein